MPVRSIRSRPLALTLALTGLVTLVPPAARAADEAPLAPPAAPEGLKLLLARAGEAPDFVRLEAELAAREREVAALFEELVAPT